MTIRLCAPLVRPDDMLGATWPDLPRATQELARQWAAILRRTNRWDVRGRQLLNVLHDGLERDVSLSVPAEVLADAYAHMITATLELLGEGSLAHPVAALFYAVSNHDQWRAVARQVLAPIGKPPPAEYPWATYRRVAGLIRLRHSDIPIWLCGDRVVAKDQED